ATGGRTTDPAGRAETKQRDGNLLELRLEQFDPAVVRRDWRSRLQLQIGGGVRNGKDGRRVAAARRRRRDVLLRVAWLFVPVAVVVEIVLGCATCDRAGVPRRHVFV